MATKTTKATSTKKPTSAKKQAIGIVARMTRRKTPATRKEIIDEMVAKTGLTSNGAATYYQNIVSGKKGWEMPTPKAIPATASK